MLIVCAISMVIGAPRYNRAESVDVQEAVVPPEGRSCDW